MPPIRQDTERRAVEALVGAMVTFAADWLTIPETAAFLRVSVRQVRPSIHDGRLRVIRIGNRTVIIRRRELDAFLAANGADSVPSAVRPSDAPRRQGPTALKSGMTSRCVQ